MICRRARERSSAQRSHSLVATLQAGEIRTKVGSKEHLLAVSTGFVEVRPGNEVVLLADTAELADELDIKKIEEARELAKKTMAIRATSIKSNSLGYRRPRRELARYKGLANVSDKCKTTCWKTLTEQVKAAPMTPAADDYCWGRDWQDDGDYPSHWLVD